jgi:hypothetical protein
MLKIERDKVYVDGYGNRFRVVCADNTAILHLPVIGVCEESGDILTFTAEGHRWLDGVSGFDLVHEVKEKHVRYINIYPNNEISHNSRQTADDCAIHDRLARIRVEYEEGQFDD